VSDCPLSKGGPAPWSCWTAWVVYRPVEDRNNWGLKDWARNGPIDSGPWSRSCCCCCCSKLFFRLLGGVTRLAFPSVLACAKSDLFYRLDRGLVVMFQALEINEPEASFVF
jgi:hypothetical protein